MPVIMRESRATASTILDTILFRYIWDTRDGHSALSALRYSIKGYVWFLHTLRLRVKNHRGVEGIWTVIILMEASVEAGSTDHQTMPITIADFRFD